MKIKSRKKMTIILAMALVAVISLGGTLAYLSTLTNEESNVFSFSENIRARLDEPNYNKKDAENPQPGFIVKKDPMITNTSGNGIDEFVAVQLTFTNGAGATLDAAQTGRLLNLLDITWNANWAPIAGTLDGLADNPAKADNPLIYAYKNKLSPGQVSDPVFSSVTIKSTISDADYAWIAGVVMNHTDDCFIFGAHDNLLCTVTYKHHALCALTVKNDPDAADTGKGGTTAAGNTCDCTPAEVHQDACPSLQGTLKGTCTHNDVPNGALGGFRIKILGAAVQAGVEGMNAWNDTATKANLIALFN